MRIGLIREGKTPPDRRAVLSPAQCAELIASQPGLEICVEPSPIRCYPDSDYQQAGCYLESDLSSCDVILGVKEVPIAQLQKNATHFFFSHTYKEQPYNRSLLKACLQKQVRLIDWELIKLHGQRLIGFGQYAGLVGAYEALRGYIQMKHLQSLPSAVELAWVADLKAQLHAHPKGNWKVLLTGRGRVGNGAREMLLAGGFNEVEPLDFLNTSAMDGPIFTILNTENYVKRSDGGAFEKSRFYSHPEEFTQAFFPYACAADIYLPCHYWKEGSPHFFSREDAQHSDFSIEFIGDISCDIAGPIPSTLRPSTMADPFYAWDAHSGKEVALGQPGSIGVLAVDNLPSAVPGDATTGFGEQFIQHVFPALLNRDKDGILAHATECQEGRLSPTFAKLDSYVNGMDFPIWDSIQWEMAMDAGLTEAHLALQALESSTGPATFENVIVALEELSHSLDRVAERLFNYNSACTNSEIQALTKVYAPQLTALSNDIRMNPKVFAKVQTVYETTSGLDPASQMLLEKTFKGFARNGALLDADGQAKLRNLDERLSQLGLEFSEHILADTEGWHLPILEADLAGLPESISQMAAQAAKSRDLSGWLLTLDAPLYMGFMTYSENRSLRKTLWQAYGQRAARGDANDNQEHVLKIANLRRERAQLLGYSSHAHFVLEERMAGQAETVLVFLNDMLAKSKPYAEKEMQDLRDFALTHCQLQTMERWDAAYVSEKFKKASLEFDDEMTKVYFPLPRVQAWAFDVAKRLYGLDFQSSQATSYHPDNQVFDVRDQDGHWVAHLHADWHPRKGKRNGAWMTSYRSARVCQGLRDYPIISMVGNFSPAVGDQPALLTFNEVLTLFHEFGHALHGMLGFGRYASLTGTSVRWDFVELPSQFMENWCYQAKELAQWARHYQTGEAMPSDILDRIQASQSFLEGMATVRQLGFGLLDMAWHHRVEAITQGDVLEKDALSAVELWPQTHENLMSPAFSHIFAGGYSAGYYSYKWAEVLDADAFERFQEEDGQETQVASDFKALLSAGGSIDPMELYTRFRGRQPRPEALLKRAGLHG